MFTGLVETMGTVRDVTVQGDFGTVTVHAGDIAAGLGHGDSVAVDGVCLTVTRHSTDEVEFEVMGETLRRSTIGGLRPGGRVNLERAMPTGGRFDGHVVQGHVDGVGTVRSRVDHPQWRTLRFGVPSQLAPLLAEKGSVTVGGVSLTVSAVSDPREADTWFEVGLIPTTLAVTTLGDLQEGDEVNLEVDVLAKYLQRMRAFDQTPEATR